MCGRSTTHFSQMVDPCTDLSSNNPRTKNLGNGGRPLRGDHGASGCEAGVGCGKKRASACVMRTACVTYSACSFCPACTMSLELGEKMGHFATESSISDMIFQRIRTPFALQIFNFVPKNHLGTTFLI